MKMVGQSRNIGWKAHELTQNLHEIKYALMGSHLSKRVFGALLHIFL